MKKQKKATKQPSKKHSFDYESVNKLIQAKEFEEAESKLTKHLNSSPKDLVATKLLIQSLFEIKPKDLDKVLNVCLNGLKIQPKDTDLMVFAAKAFAAKGQTQQAYEMLAKRVQINPKESSFHLDLGRFLRDIGKQREAIKAFETSHKLDPQKAQPLVELSNLYKITGEKTKALKLISKAIDLDSENPKLHNNLGTLLTHMRQINASIKAFEAAIKIDPKNHIYLSNLGNSLYTKGKIKEAAAAYASAVEIKPDHAFAIGQELHARRQLCDWSKIDELIDNIKSLISTNNATGIAPFVLLSQPNISLEEIRLGTRAFSDNHHRAFLKKPPMVDSKYDTRKPNERLRIGYLSADFHEHATSYLIVGVLEHHDKSQFDTYAYSYGIDDKSPMRSRVKKSFTVFRDIQKMTEEQAAKLIYEDNIDILVDLKGYTRDMRLGIQALRPAPIIVSWLGYPGTLATPRLADYVIGDETVTPLSHARFYSEKLAIMPHCYQPNDRDRVITAGITRADEGLPEDKFVFCSFNQTYKITPSMFDLWCSILNKVDNSILWILEPRDKAAQQNLINEAKSRGLSEDRIYFASKRPQADHLGRVHLADLALDTLPYTSHTTASDALWVGLPLITLIGETFPARVAASILKAINVPELITETPEAFIELATTLANNPSRLAQIKQKILDNRLKSPLYNTEIFARNMEKLYQGMWQRHLKQNSHLTVNQTSVDSVWQRTKVPEVKGKKMPVILVLGPWSSGSSATTGLLSHAGLFTPGPHASTNDPRTPNTYENLAFRSVLWECIEELTLRRKLRPEQVISKLIEFSEKTLKPLKRKENKSDDEPIVLKHALAAFIVPELSKVFDLKIINVIRPLDKIEKTRIRRNWQPVFGELGAKHTYTHMFKESLNSDIPSIFIEFHELLNNPEMSLDRLESFLSLNLSEDDRQKAIAFLYPPEKK